MINGSDRLFCSSVSSANGRPVLGLRSKRGKLLLEISMRIEWPARNTLLVTPASIVNRIDLAGLRQFAPSPASR